MIPKILVFAALVAAPFLVHADEMRRVSVTYQLDVEVLGTEQPHVAWKGQGPLRYRWHEGAGEIVGGDIPRMTAPCPVKIPGYDMILLAVGGAPGSLATITFEGTDVVVDHLDLDLDVMEAVTVAGVAVPPPQGRAMLRLRFSDLRLTSGTLIHKGQKFQGKLDAETMSADLIFLTTIPKTGNVPLDAEIAGKTVVGRLHIALKNP